MFIVTRTLSSIWAVALRKESVDRNIGVISPPTAIAVALRKESVDRNCAARVLKNKTGLSLSARRAWIEISKL